MPLATPPRPATAKDLAPVLSDMLCSQELTFKLARQLTVRAVENGDRQTRAQMAALMESLADQYGQMSRVAELMHTAAP